jgi:carbonic anhydrase
VSKLLGLEEGDAHVIRNAGGVVTDDESRSLAISQRLLGTPIVLIHRTDCGMLTFKDDDFHHQIEEETGVRPEWAAEAFEELDQDVRQNIARIKTSPLHPQQGQRARLRLRRHRRPPARSESSGVDPAGVRFVLHTCSR